MLFGAKITDVRIRNGKIAGVCLGDTTVEGAAVILATGHSARDIYEILHRRGVRIEAKPFAMGVRAEHPQQLIDRAQYHLPERGEYLPAASYSLVSQVGGRGVYSFCMCPGGFIVPAMTRAGESVVNGMSPSGRNSVFANSGIVTEIRLSDFEHLRAEHGELAGLRFQQQFEELAYRQIGDRQIAPAQRLADFVAGKASAALLLRAGHRRDANGTVDARHDFRRAAGRPGLVRQETARIRNERGARRRRRIAHFFAGTHPARSGDADAPADRGAFPGRRGRRIRRGNHLGRHRRRTVRRPRRRLPCRKAVKSFL